ncbi:MAG: Asp-tRNA(Asn)/Glu-tRNA(Gln) amidotransferase subunit GatC [Bacteroidota bacterium]|nr:Asp-tRNA(Asn)/Glu-tRNA(Gln) amidotransferase subunit GatC [Bacteroidota bacterium]MDX5431115.1 Asp-tRNA(Asn)/Glu-tRNA(Gln) amidotransferase subunit GatC [Bacteroidota bacterium]MDX5469866.1 Asp-tRNA(Asn)/Glu-tRNA(Gln) amidotransferase subunit GatC [Bacteroidota bacterium]
MRVNDETIDRLAHLARLEFVDQEKDQIKQDLEKVLGFCEQLNGLDTEGVEPMIFMTEEHNILREDEVRQDITHEEALKNAPKKDSDYFRVPKVINK